MLYNFLKLIYTKINYFLSFYLKFKWKYINFILPNLFFIITRKVIYDKLIRCSQKMYLTGTGTIHIDENCAFGEKLGGRFRGGCIELQVRYKDSTIKIERNVATNNNLFICSSNFISVGAFSLIGENVTIMDFEAHGINPRKRRGGYIEKGKVIIGENVWIGNGVTILKNSTIGKNTIIAAGAVVKGVFPENVIIGGVPAKILKKIDEK